MRCVDYRVVKATSEHVPCLPDVEIAAASRFSGMDVPESVFTDATDLKTLLAAQDAGLLWVALEPDGTVIGFAFGADLDDTLGLEELDVIPECSGRDVGSALIEAVISEARERCYPYVYLSTYRDVPWNAPWYRRQGFEVADVDDPIGQQLLARDTEQGLSTMPRVALRRETAAQHTGPADNGPREVDSG